MEGYEWLKFIHLPVVHRVVRQRNGQMNTFKENNLNADDMTINELLDFIVENPSVLRRPIIVDKHRLQVGYNDEEIRCFLPRELRNVIYCNNCDNCNCSYVGALERALKDNFIEKASMR